MHDARRAKTVEPVWGTLINFRAIKKVYTKGIDFADKQVLLAAMAYNLKKLMAYTTIKSTANAMKLAAVELNSTVLSVLNDFLRFYQHIFIAVTKNYRCEILLSE
ncbi:hypothetical protein AGMMS49525_18300 [Bacteroidia bacterium]|nr:hypothetical protein AGMMS49525_18300 [Bacteroidia bacterium]